MESDEYDDFIITEKTLKNCDFIIADIETIPK